jgi:hypothetical protein
VNLSDFLDDLMPRLPGATEELVNHELYAALRQLCEEGWAWYQDITIDVKAAKQTYYLDPLPGNARVGYVLSAFYNPTSGYRRRLTPMVTIPAAIVPNPNPDSEDDTPIGYLMTDPGTMKLSPTPSADAPKGLTIGLTAIPLSPTCSFPDYFFTHYRDTLIDGVMARMQLMKSMAWSDTNLATINGRKWRNWLNRTRDITKRRYSTGDRNWRFPYFAAQRR